MNKSTRYSPEVRERAVRMVFEHEREYGSQWATISSIAGKIGCTPETLRRWVRRTETDEGRREGLTTSDRERVKASRAREPRAASSERHSAHGVRVFCPGGARPPTQVMVRYIDDHKDRFGVEPICAVLPIAPSTYYEQKAREHDPDATAGACDSRRGAEAARSSASGTRTSASTVRTRSGSSSSVKGSAWRAARSSG